MLGRARKDLREDIKYQVSKEAESRFESEAEGKYSLLIESMPLFVIRHMEDYAFNKMAALLTGIYQ